MLLAGDEGLTSTTWSSPKIFLLILRNKERSPFLKKSLNTVVLLSIILLHLTKESVLSVEK